MTLQPGTQFGRYELVSRLGYGGMAETWLARLLGEAGFAKTVLIKKVLPEYADDYAFTSMLISEARICGTLSHDNIAQVFDFGRVGNEYYLGMEYVDGQPLNNIVQHMARMGGGGVPVPPAAFIGIHICRGLHYAHTRKDGAGKPLSIVHRDISPENVLVSYEGQVKIVDFGLAKARELRDMNTEPGVVKGKYLFFSPEQARGLEVDARTDVWATGIVMYEMLCGKVPVEGPEYVVMPKLSQGEFPRPRDINPKVPQELEDIIMGALTVRREDRYSSSHVFGDALAEFLYSYAPQFSTMTLSYFMQEMFRDALLRAGRDVSVPASFQDEMASWRSERPSAVAVPAALPAPAPESPRPEVMAAVPAASPSTPAPASPAPAVPGTQPLAPKLSPAVWRWTVGAGTALGWLAIGLTAIAIKRTPHPETDAPPAATEASVVPGGSKTGPEVPPPPRKLTPSPPVVDIEKYLQQAKAALTGRRYEVAAENYRAALKFQPGSLEAKEGLGFALVLGRTDEDSNAEAVKLLQDVVEQDSLKAHAWYFLGMALQATKEEKEAADAYKQYLVLDPSGRFSRDARNSLARMGEN
ncbi:serine/threonine-protein kinase [Hyalangium minutum]|uniref:Serine/threonine protein kinase PrkC, regulator of stationary phase n=1 Tax=Hyalangium minutum TaxID=394096 RepID=A0A085WWK2_9BACT|nr:serine/threonine-protein kinase [Hyalangium minutum]KFE72065.1 Serine/threonine protein kinase PrkC, regulator of stationary phase [Hyalangium minutum]